MQVKYLNICDNAIGDDGFAAVALCIDKIDDLRIGFEEDEQLSIDGVITVCNAIQNRPSKVRPV